MNEQIIPDDSHLVTMKYSEHLSELRKRLIQMVSAILIVFFVLLPFAKESYHLLAQRLLILLPKNSSIIATDVMSTFLTPFKLTLYLALVVTIPYSLYQIWRFIAPALYQTEKNSVSAY